MPNRFCPTCGTATLADANFCMACGDALPGTAAQRRARVVRPTLLGGLVLGGFLLVGLAIWAAILTPDAPAPGPGGRRVAAAPGGAAPAAPARPLPEDVTRMIADLAKEADAAPDDVDRWVHLGEVYYRTSRIDPAFRARALAAFEHVLARDPDRTEAIRGVGNIYYDRNDPERAIPRYERFLELQPGDPAVRTDLATMYLAAGETERAFTTYRAVIADHPDFMQAHYNLAAALHQEGDQEAALAELRVARTLTTDEQTGERIDELIGRLSGTTPSTVPAGLPPNHPPIGGAAERTPFQAAVERAFRGHEVMGPRIAAVEWTADGTGRVLLQGFPMEAMPDGMRDSFETRLVGMLKEARQAHPVGGAVSVALVDSASGRVMMTVTP